MQRTHGGSDGYMLTGSDGGVFDYGNIPFCGSTGSIHLNMPVVTTALTADGGGYWLVASDGGIFAFGTPSFYGCMGGTPLNAPIVGMAATPNGNGYWLVASDGGIFSFGDARFFGSMGGTPLNAPLWAWRRRQAERVLDRGVGRRHLQLWRCIVPRLHGGQSPQPPVVGIATDSQTGGYWEVAADGGIFSLRHPLLRVDGQHPSQRPDRRHGGRPGWLVGTGFVASDGGIFTYDEPFYGSMGGTPLNKPVVGMAGT